MKRELEGKITVKLSDHTDLGDLCASKIPGYDPQRFEIVAIRVFAGSEFIVTVYAADKLSAKNVKVDKFPVKKFKLENLTFAELHRFAESFNFTLCNEEYNMEDMEVTNK